VPEETVEEEKFEPIELKAIEGLKKLDSQMLRSDESFAQVEENHVSANAKEEEKGEHPEIKSEKQPQRQKVEESIRVNLGRIDKLMNNVGELVILQTMLSQHKKSIESLLVQKTIHQLEKITREIQDISMSLRMVPLKQTFQKMQRIVRDTSLELAKEVRLEISGEDTELDKTVLEQIGDPLVHLIRNAVDHGLESKNERIQTGKSEVGLVQLSANNRGSHIVIEVRDDGKGLDPKKLVAKALEKGLIKSGQDLSDEQAYELIFAPGFSTKAIVTNVSGRGVGMDVVKTNITRLSGEIQIETHLGTGTCFRILLPLTIAIIDGIVVRVSDQNYVVPVSNIHESMRPKVEQIGTVTGVGEVLKLRGETLPVYRLGKLLGLKSDKISINEATAMVVRPPKMKPFAVLVDEMLKKQQVVIKRLGEEIRGTPGITGGAILGDGKAALIIDFPELVERIKVGHSNVHRKGI
jgi:two-component system chemotaxis sensor kinase CheA